MERQATSRQGSSRHTAETHITRRSAPHQVQYLHRGPQRLVVSMFCIIPSFAQRWDKRTCCRIYNIFKKDIMTKLTYIVLVIRYGLAIKQLLCHCARVGRENEEMPDTMWCQTAVCTDVETCILLDSALVGAQESTISGS